MALGIEADNFRLTLERLSHQATQLCARLTVLQEENLQLRLSERSPGTIAEALSHPFAPKCSGCEITPTGSPAAADLELRSVAFHQTLDSFESAVTNNEEHADSFNENPAVPSRGLLKRASTSPSLQTRSVSFPSTLSQTVSEPELHTRDPRPSDGRYDPRRFFNNGKTPLGMVMHPFQRALGVPKHKRSRIFADPEELKEKMLEMLMENPHPLDPNEGFKENSIFSRIARHQRFQTCSLLLVVFSAAWITIDLDYNEEPSLAQADIGFRAVAHILCTCFVLEICIRALAYKTLLSSFSDRWFIFDFMLALFIVMETWVIDAVIDERPLAPEGGGSPMRAVGLLRLLRLLRVLRFGRVVRELPELFVIAKGVLYAFQAIVVILLLIGAMIYTAAVVLRVLTEDTPIGGTRFKTVAKAMGTLLLQCTLSGSKGTDVILEAWNDSPVFSVIIFCYVLLANITMMGVLTGVLVQTVRTTTEVEKEQAIAQDISTSIKTIWDRLADFDHDSDNCISEEEFPKVILDESFARTLRSVGVDLESFIDSSSFLFKQHGNKMTRTAFHKIILDLRGREQAKVKHHIETRKLVHSWIQEQLKMIWDSFTHHQRETTSALKALRAEARGHVRQAEYNSSRSRSAVSRTEHRGIV